MVGSTRKMTVVFGIGIAIFLTIAGLFVFKGNGRNATQFKQNLHINTRRAEDPATGVVKNPERHEEFLERAKQGNIDVLFLGDSLTELFPVVGQESWLKLFPYKPASFGIGGDCTEHLIWRIEHGELDSIAPKVVVILIGTNNLFYHSDDKPEWTAAAISKIVGIVQARLPKSKVVLFGIFPRDERGSEKRNMVVEVNQRIQQLGKGDTVRYVDIGADFLDGDGQIPVETMPDQLHLSPTGYAIWYRALEPILREMMATNG